MEIRQGFTSFMLAALLFVAAMLLALQAFFAPAALFIGGSALLFAYGRWVDATTSPS
jgi:hypothetical protein